MARTKDYQHYCPVARALEVIGEKWSLLVVRDLLRGPQRFTDLLRYLGGITPKWLTMRLRELEAAGIVERDCEPGRREVWYRLTPRGRDLAPVVGALAVWGIDHASRPPLPGEPVHPAQSIGAMVTYRNVKQVTLPRPATWLLRFGPDRAYTVRFDGERWSAERGEPAAPPDLTVESTPEDWVTFLNVARAQRHARRDRLKLTGDPPRIDEFLASFGVGEAPTPESPRL